MLIQLENEILSNKEPMLLPKYEATTCLSKKNCSVSLGNAGKPMEGLGIQTGFCVRNITVPYNLYFMI